MKIKKILSLAMALGIVAGSMGTLAYAEAVPTITMTAYEYGTEEGTAYIEEKNGEAIGTTDQYSDGVYIPEGCTGYLVVSSVAGMPDMKKATKGDHQRFGGLSAYFDIDNASNIDHIAVFTYGMVDTGATGGLTDAGEAFLKPSTSVSAAYPTSATVVNDVDEVSALFIVLKDKNSPVKFTALASSDLSGLYSGVYTVNYNANTMKDTNKMQVKDGAAAFAAESFTLGQAGSQGGDGDDDAYAFSAGTENIYADGIVWAGASMTNFDTTANEYWAEFTADGVTEPRKTLIKNLPESEESITFDAVMWFAGEAKTGVTFDINEYAIAE